MPDGNSIRKMYSCRGSAQPHTCLHLLPHVLHMHGARDFELAYFPHSACTFGFGLSAYALGVTNIASGPLASAVAARVKSQFRNLSHAYLEFVFPAERALGRNERSFWLG